MDKVAYPLDNTSGGHGGWLIFCPACVRSHLFDKRWTFNGDQVKPTFKPSMLVIKGETQPRCHSFVTSGTIEYLADCTHEMAGKTMELEPF